MNYKKSNIVNWEKVFSYSNTFQNNTPCKWAFIEEFLERDFYEQLYETYPKYDNGWSYTSTEDKNAYRKLWSNRKANEIDDDIRDPKYSEAWNKFHHYLYTDDFIQHMRKFSGVKVDKPKHFTFMLLKRGGYQLPHIHNVGPTTLIMMIYFSKGWQKGDPGGTYVTPEEDESKMIFEPYNLDNSMMIFHDGPYAGHGVRYIEKNVERRAVQIYLEEYSTKTGWSGDPVKRELKEI